MDTILERSHELKQALLDFVMEAEGELAEALEAYAAKTSSNQKQQDIAQRELLIDTFLIEGKVADKTPIDLFLESQPKLSQSDRDLVTNWRNSFMGLFAVAKILPDGVELINWLTTKHYIVKPNNSKLLEDIARFKEGEILLTRISPVTNNYWMFSSAYTSMGNLGKPKLAVAIGNFKDNYKSSLYSDAPELLEQAWHSVEKYHQEFVQFFGADEVTISGYQLGKKLTEFQEKITEQRLTAAGIDPNKSFQDIAAESGVSETEIKEAAAAAGANSESVTELFDSKDTTKMVMPKIEVPDNLKKAEQVTVLTHPRWGQIFLPTYTQFKKLLETEDWQTIKGAEKLVRQYLEDPAINFFIWDRLRQQYPISLEKVLQTVLARPELKIERDLEPLLKEFNKNTEPELPDIASVPLHLHNLFQEAVTEVNKAKSKAKEKKQPQKGFQRK